MPFALYSINPNLIKKSENIKSKQLTKFINDIEEEMDVTLPTIH